MRNVVVLEPLDAKIVVLDAVNLQLRIAVILKVHVSSRDQLEQGHGGDTSGEASLKI